jgi:uncharacterized membrane protein
MGEPNRARRPPSNFPFWGVLALPACALWGTLIGVLVGFLFGNPAIGAAIGAGLGVGLGLSLLAAAIVIASTKI